MAAYLDYKFRQILRDGVSTTVTVAFYRGEDVPEADPITGQPVTVYKRSGKVRDQAMTFRGDVDDAELRRVLNERLLTLLPANPGRSVHPAQIVTAPSTARAER